MVESKLCLIDANSLFYRAFFAIKAQLVTSDGRPTNAIFGFVKMLNKIMEDIHPEYIGICFDVSKVTHRTKAFADYKINRPKMPQPLVMQLPYIKKVVEAYNFPIFEAQGFEADDVIASIVARVAKEALKVVIVSSDKDILQLVNDNVEVYNPYKEEGIVFTQKVVKDKFGVEPARIKDLIALMGDSSDNIPGAHGIGAKTALGLLSEFKDVEDLKEHKTKIKREKIKKIIEDNLDLISLSKKLATLREDVPLDLTFSDLKVKPPDYEKLWDLFKDLEFKGMLKSLCEDRLSGPRSSAAVSKKKADDLQGLKNHILQKGVFAFFVREDEADQKTFSVNIALDERDVFEVTDASFLKSLFSESECLGVSHDVKRARHILRRCGIDSRIAFFDTMIAAYLIESSKSSKDFEGLLWDHLSLKGLSRLDVLGKESHFLLKLKGVLTKALEDKELLKLFNEVEMPLVDVLFEMESAGIKIDTGLLKRLSRELDKRLEGLISAIYDLAGSSFNINSPKQLSEVLFHKLKLGVVKKTKTGFSTNEEVLRKLSEGHDLPKLLLEYRQITKLKTTYIDAFPALADAKTGVIHGLFNQTGTETGRLSSSKPNLQNIPIRTELGRRIREAFIPSEGFDGLLSADYSQIELRILAHLAEDDVLMKAFKEGLDIHRYTASLIFGVAEDDVSDEMRENAKRVNFGIIYGMSSYGLAKDLGMPAQTAQDFIDEYFMRYSKVKEYLDAQIAFVKKHGFVTTILGRRRYIPEISNSNIALRQFAERQAINAPVQGSAADLIKRAMVDVRRRLLESGLKSRLTLQVHDELVFEVKAKEKEGLVSLVRDAMENAICLRVPVKVTLRLGKNWLAITETF